MLLHSAAAAGIGRSPEFLGVRCARIGYRKPRKQRHQLDVGAYKKAGVLPLSIDIAGNYNMAVNSAGSFYPTSIVGLLYPDSLSGRGNGFMNPGGSNFWTYTTTNGVACPGGGTTSTYTLWHMIELFGTNHTLPTTYKTDTAGCLSGSGFSGPVQDGSGIVVTANATGTVVTAADSSGTSLLSSSLTDAHGNTLSLASGTYTDSMGLTPIVVTGTAPAATFTWKDVSGFDQAVSIGVTQKTVQTAFACAASNDVASFAAFPPTSISFPDSTSLGLSYEISTGTKITGRLDTITLREGGTVRYTYSGGNSGIDCNYWVTPVLTRTLGNGDVTTYTLTHPFVSGSNYQALNTVVDPGGNQTEYTFTGFTSSGASSTYAQALTQKKVYSGNGAGKSLLYTELRSYNSAFTSTPNATTISQTTVSLPVGEIVVYRQYAGQSGWAAVDTAYDSYGNPLSVSQYDYGVATPAITTTTAYGSCTASCTSNLPTVLNTSMAANGIFNKPGSIKTTMGGNVVAQTNIVYDSVGDAQTIYRWTGSTWLSNTTANTYNNNGTPLHLFDVNNNETDYSYSTGSYSDTSGCTGLSAHPPFPTQIKDVTTALHTDYTYDCVGGVPLSASDVNGNQTNFGYKYGSGAGLPGTMPDPFWRVRTTADPYSNVHYTDIYSNSAVPTFFTNGTNSVMQTYRNWDGYHRPVGQQRYQAWGGSTFDTTTISYGWVGTGPMKLCNLQFAAVFGILWRYLHAVPHSHIRSSRALSLDCYYWA